MTILKTPLDGCYELTTNSFGTYLKKVADPDANVTVSKEQFEGFEVLEDFKVIPASLWQRWIQLCFEMTRRNAANLEVSCRLLYKEDDNSQWRILVPKQVVSGASVRVDSFDSSIDIETGEVIEEYPPVGWVPCGSSHSHNTMSAFFSGTDDKYELGDPGLHVVVGDVNLNAMTYALKASVTANKRRFTIDYNKVIDITPIENAKFHPDVLSLIKIERHNFQRNNSNYQNNRKLASIYSKQKDWHQYQSWHDIDDYNNPFYWQDEYVNSNKFTKKSSEFNDPFISIDYINTLLDNTDFSDLNHQETDCLIDELKDLTSKVDELITSLTETSLYFFKSEND